MTLPQTSNGGWKTVVMAGQGTILVILLTFMLSGYAASSEKIEAQIAEHAQQLTTLEVTAANQERLLSAILAELKEVRKELTDTQRRHSQK